jgi:hypothetical protein
VAPFHIFLKAGYEIAYLNLDEDFYATSAWLQTTISKGKGKAMVFKIELRKESISEFSFSSDNLEFKAICVES